MKSYSHEVTAAYVFRYPRKHWTPFVLAGADFSLSRHVYVRAEYRGLVYNSPTYDIPGLADLGRITHRAEPSAGIGYRF